VWRTIVDEGRALHGVKGAEAAGEPLPLVRAKHVDIELVPHYERTANDEAVAEAVRKRDRRRLREHLGGAVMPHLTADVKISVRDLTLPETQVRVENATNLSELSAIADPALGSGQDAVRVSWRETDASASAGKLRYPVLRVTFPNDHLYDVLLDVSISDGLGNQGGLSHFVWNYGLAAENASQLVESALKAAGGDAEQTTDAILDAAGSPRVPGVDHRKASLARRLLISADRLSHDHFITIDEFGRLVLLAEEFSSITHP
jgi:hypothetical protein